jgi:hypothetical protein
LIYRFWLPLWYLQTLHTVYWYRFSKICSQGIQNILNINLLIYWSGLCFRGKTNTAYLGGGRGGNA